MIVCDYLMGIDIFEFQPNFCMWQLFKECNRQGIFFLLVMEK